MSLGGLAATSTCMGAQVYQHSLQINSNDNIGLTNLMGEGMIDFIPPQMELQEISPGTGGQCFVSFVFVVLGAQG